MIDLLTANGVLLITNVVYTYIVFLLMRVIYKNDNADKLTEFISYVLFYLAITFFHDYQNGIESYFVLAGMLFVVALNYGRSYYTRLYISILVFVFTNIFYVVTVGVCMEILNLHLANVTILFLARLCMIVMYVGLIKFRGVANNLLVSEKKSVFVIIIPLISLIILFNLILTMENTLWLIFDIMGICIINVIMFYVFDYMNDIYRKKNEENMVRQQNEYYNRQFAIMRENNEKLRSLRHDLKNHLIYIQSQSNGSVETYKSSLANILEGCDHSRSGNLAIDSILNFKIGQALENGFDFKLKIAVPETMKLDETDLVTLLGNIVDNSIEHCNPDKKEVKLVIRYETGILYFDSSNSCDEIQIENGLIKTTKPDRNNHGIGLKSIKSVVNKYNGEMMIENENKLFRITIMLPC